MASSDQTDAEAASCNTTTCPGDPHASEKAACLAKDPELRAALGDAAAGTEVSRTRPGPVLPLAEAFDVLAEALLAGWLRLPEITDEQRAFLENELLRLRADRFT